MTSDRAYALLCQASYVGNPDYGTPDGARAFRATIDGMLTICFPGSRTLEEWFLDFLAVPVADDDIVDRGALGPVHAGFLKRSHDCLALVHGDIAIEDDYVLCGHSLGGAIALGVGAHMVIEGHPPSRIVTFGAPRFGFGPFVELMATVKKIPQYRFGDDPVPGKPPWPWRHARKLVQIGDAVPDLFSNHNIINYLGALPPA